MLWYQVVIADDDSADFAVASLLNGFIGECIDAGTPEGVAVFRGRTAHDEHVFYFSPVAVSIATDLLDDFGATACATEPSLDGVTQIPI